VLYTVTSTCHLARSHYARDRQSGSTFPSGHKPGTNRFTCMNALRPRCCLHHLASLTPRDTAQPRTQGLHHNNDHWLRQPFTRHQNHCLPNWQRDSSVSAHLSDLLSSSGKSLSGNPERLRACHYTTLSGSDPTMSDDWDSNEGLANMAIHDTGSCLGLAGT